MLAGLPRQSDVDHELSASDHACLRDLKAVLERYGSSRRFGITLLHRHFDVTDDEVPLESVDLETRTSTVTMRKVAEIEGTSIATAWRLDGDHPQVVARCPATCGPPDLNPDGQCDHYSEHRNFVLAHSPAGSTPAPPAPFPPRPS